MAFKRNSPGCKCECGPGPGTPSPCAASGYPSTHTNPLDDLQTLTLTWSWLGSDTVATDPDCSNQRNQGLAGPRDTPVIGSMTVTLYRATRDNTGGTGVQGAIYDSGNIAFPTGYPKGARTGPGGGTAPCFYGIVPDYPPPFCRVWVGCYLSGGTYVIRANARELSSAQASSNVCRPAGSSTCGGRFNSTSSGPFFDRNVDAVLSTSPIHWRWRVDRGPTSGGPDSGSVAYDILDVTE